MVFLAYLGHIFPRYTTPLAHSDGVAIRTNSPFCSLTINAQYDEVDHFGLVGDLNIIAVKKASYDEYGRVGGVATLTYGKLNVKNSGEVTTIVSSPEAADDVVLTVEEKGTVKTIVSDNQTVLDAFVAANPSKTIEAEKVADAAEIEKVKTSVAYVLHSDESKTYYDSFSVACNSAADDETVVAMKDTQYNAAINSTLISIAAGKSITLDLNGKVISGVLDNAKSAQVITVKGTLTIKDDTNVGGLNFNTKFGSASPWSVAVRVIFVDTTGTLNLQSGNIIAGSASGTYGIDSSGALNITGGHIHGGYVGIRSNGTATISGGTFDGTHGFFMQKGTATLSNVKIECEKNAIYLWHSSGNITISINNCDLQLGTQSLIYFSSYSNDYVSTATIDGEEIEVPVDQKTTDYLYTGE